MKPLRWLLLAAVCWLAAGAHAPLAAQDPLVPPKLIKLGEQLEYLLLIRMEEERIFLGKVLKAVGQGDLKDDVVVAVAYRARGYNQRFPFPYFQVMIEKIAKQRGVVLGS